MVNRPGNRPAPAALTAAALTVALLIACACAPLPAKEDSRMPTRLEFIWNTGSIPPPDYYQYRIVIGPHPGAEIRMRPDYPDANPPEWVQAFPVSADTVKALCQTALDLPDCPPDPVARIGGGRAELFLVPLDASPRPICVDNEAGRQLARSIQALVPEATWKTLYERFDRYRTSR